MITVHQIPHMLDINLNSEESFVENSEIKNLIPGKKYILSTRVSGTKGESFSGYFGVIFLNKNKKEIGRKIHWLNDFSNSEKKLSIIFEAPSEKALFIYRINNETPIKSICKYVLLPTNEFSISQTKATSDEFFDSLENYVLPEVKELTTEEELTLEKNLVWIFSSARSGSSWLALQLLSFNTFSINEFHLADHLSMITGNVGRGFFRTFDENEHLSDYFFSSRYKNTWKFYLRKLILNRLFAQVQDISKKVVIKEPGSFGASDIITGCLPNSRIILLLRDGRDVLDSLVDARQKIGFMTKKSGLPPIKQKDRLGFLKGQSRMWKSLWIILMKTYEDYPDQLKYLVRYENLRKNTYDELKKIYAFLDINIPDNKLNEMVTNYSFENVPEKLRGSGKFHRSATPGKWKQNFSIEEKVLIENMIGDLLKKMDYK